MLLNGRCPYQAIHCGNLIVFFASTSLLFTTSFEKCKTWRLAIIPLGNKHLDSLFGVFWAANVGPFMHVDKFLQNTRKSNSKNFIDIFDTDVFEKFHHFLLDLTWNIKWIIRKYRVWDVSLPQKSLYLILLKPISKRKLSNPEFEKLTVIFNQ